MRLRRSLSLVAAVSLLGAVAVSSPAVAAPQPGFGMTLDVLVHPGAQSGLEATAYVPLTGGGIVVSTSSAVAANTVLTITEGATELATCTVFTGTTGCGDSLPALDAGTHNVTYTFDDGVDSVSFSGTIFAVVAAQPTIMIEWQDADGTWIDGTDTALPLLASTSTVGRCTVTNNSNAAGTLTGFTTSVSHPSGPPTIVNLTDTLAAGESRSFTMFSGSAGDAGTYNCSGSILFPSTTGSGNGEGGAIVPVEGSISASPLTVDPGGTVSIAGAGLLPVLSTNYAITVDGLAAPGSPATLVMPGGELDFDVVFPSSGTYTLAVHNVYEGQNITFASFTVNVTGLAATGTDVAVPLSLGLLLLFSGAAILAARARAA